jgi:histidinol-phosphate/aromatic aminotransferase/cobyric acid decarboxylase-like protein
MKKHIRAVSRQEIYIMKPSEHTRRRLGLPISRRGFLIGAMAGAGAMTLMEGQAAAQIHSLPQGPLTAADIVGNGAPPGEVRLNNNENPLGASMRVGEAVVGHLFEMNRFYSSGALPKTIARLHGLTEDDLRRPDGPAIAVAPGTSFIQHALGVLAVGRNGAGEVIEAIPAYGLLSRTFETFRTDGAGVNILRVPLTRSFTHDLNAMRAAVTPRTTLIVITNPNNPTGTIVPH